MLSAPWVLEKASQKGGWEAESGNKDVGRGWRWSCSAWRSEDFQREGGERVTVSNWLRTGQGKGYHVLCGSKWRSGIWGCKEAGTSTDRNPDTHGAGRGSEARAVSFPFLQPRKQRADGRDGSGELRNPVSGGLHGLTIPVFTNLAHLIITSVSGSASSETNSVGLFAFLLLLVVQHLDHCLMKQILFVLFLEMNAYLFLDFCENTLHWFFFSHSQATSSLSCSSLLHIDGPGLCVPPHTCFILLAKCFLMVCLILPAKDFLMSLNTIRHITHSPSDYISHHSLSYQGSPHSFTVPAWLPKAFEFETAAYFFSLHLKCHWSPEPSSPLYMPLICNIHFTSLFI